MGNSSWRNPSWKHSGIGLCRFYIDLPLKFHKALKVAFTGCTFSTEHVSVVALRGAPCTGWQDYRKDILLSLGLQLLHPPIPHRLSPGPPLRVNQSRLGTLLNAILPRFGLSHDPIQANGFHLPWKHLQSGLGVMIPSVLTVVVNNSSLM